MKVPMVILLVLLMPGLALAENAQTRSTVADRQDLAITLYSNDFGLVREVRKLRLPVAVVEVVVDGVAATIDPTSVAVASLTRPKSLHLLEQSYHAGLLNPTALLTRYIGRTVKFVNEVQQDGALERRVREGELLSVAGAPIVRFGDEIEIDPRGSVVLPALPDDLRATPALVWLLDNGYRRAQEIELSYIAGGMNWQVDYVAVVDGSDSAIDLTGWVTLNNGSGVAYRDTTVKLVAGDVQRVYARPAMATREVFRADMAQAAPAFEESGLFEHHLYTLDRRVSLADGESKQIMLLQGQGVAVTKRLVVESNAHVYSANKQGGEPAVNVSLRFYNSDNSEKSALGVPLPAGRVRLYKADRDGAAQLIGEERIGHTPRDERVELSLGRAFDIKAERRQTSYRRRGERSAEVAFEVSLRNHKEESVAINVVEHLPGEWTITQESHPHEKVDAATFSYLIDVPAKGLATLTYSAQVTW